MLLKHAADVAATDKTALEHAVQKIVDGAASDFNEPARGGIARLAVCVRSTRCIVAREWVGQGARRDGLAH